MRRKKKCDYAHVEFVMRGIQQAMEQYPEKNDAISLSPHCETAEIMAAYIRLVQKEGKLSGLRAYGAARLLHSEGRRRGLSLNRMAELASWNAARRFGLGGKGDLAPGFGAGIVLFDP